MRTVLWLSSLAVVSLPAAAQTTENAPAVHVDKDLFDSPNISASAERVLGWLREGGDPDTIMDGEANTFLHYAAPTHLEILRTATRRGGDCNRRNAYGATPLHFAASQGSPAISPGPDSIRLLVRCEAAPNIERTCAGTGSADAGGQACAANPNAQDRRGDTPLHAVYRGVEKSPAPLVRNLGTTALDSNRESPREDIAQVLLEEAGADPNVRNGNGDTALMLAIRFNGVIFTKPGHVSLLLEHGTDPDLRNRAGATPLIEALSLHNTSRFGDDEIERLVVLLLRHGADPDLRNGKGDTPLIHAAKHEDDIATEMEALLAGGADPCLRDRNGRLARDHAGPDGRELLYKAGGWLDRETGLCVRELEEAKRAEAKLALDRGKRRRLQSCLARLDFDPGTPDGVLGPRSRQAIRAWQATQGAEGIAAAGFFLDADATEALLDSCTTAFDPACTGRPADTPEGCWMQAEGRSDCRVWNPLPQQEETVSWDGPCVDGRPSGEGRRTWRFREDGRMVSESHEGSFQDGRRQGHFVDSFSDGAVWEGSYEDDERSGLWVRRDAGPGLDARCFRRGERVDLGHCLKEAGPPTARVLKDATVLRIGPGEAFGEQGATLSAGERVEVTHTAAGWARIEADGRAGFVPMAMLDEVKVPVAGTKFRDCVECPELVVVPAGSFRMGSPAGESGRDDDEGPVHRVEIGEPLAVGVYEVTFSEWEACRRDGGCSHNPDDHQGWGRGNRPVINVSWRDAREYVRWLSRKTGEGYRLLSESEWEYAARAGTRTRYSWGDSVGRNRANCTDCGSRWDDDRTAPVGSFAANAFGLHDMHGNVWEWVEDCWHESYEGAPSDGSAWTFGCDSESRVLRGGSWYDVPRLLRSAYRDGFASGHRLIDVGFRVARTLD